VSDEVNLLLRQRNEIVDIEQIPSGNGIFDVALDGKILFSKYDTGRFPQTGEIAGLLLSLI